MSPILLGILRAARRDGTADPYGWLAFLIREGREAGIPVWDDDER